ncbi:transposase [Pelagibaculum spongiae]|uniref:transposase n=1 Tax=Pelagibaculum spongiae TaxID=2080658 RepID=UPI0010577CFB|nr:transposase [Pelagibaculum spongiae]
MDACKKPSFFIMPAPRAILFDPKANPYVHACSRCVRRGWLCGEDPAIVPELRKNYDHRRQWIVDRIDLLARAFSIDVAAYAVMSNHYHLVLYVDVARANKWSARQVLLQYTKVFDAEPLVKKYLNSQKRRLLSAAEIHYVEAKAEECRKRLYSISWFMKSINEPLARLANAEDHCKGRFWEGRFKAQALLDEQALLTCMAYVDLNPLRAGIAKTPETSDYTSIQARVETELPEIASNQTRIKNNKKSIKNRRYDYQFALLKPFSDSAHLKNKSNEPHVKQKPLPFSLNDYLELVDASARMARNDKKYHMDSQLPPIFDRLKIDTTAVWWAKIMSGQSKALSNVRAFAHAIGSYLNISAFKARVMQQTKVWRANQPPPKNSS